MIYKKWLYILATIIAVVLIIVYRRLVLPERIADKVDDMLTPKGNTETEIFNAAVERLNRKFTATQAQRLAGYMIAMSKHETANYTSNVFKRNKNAFGYKYFAGSPYQIGRGTASPEGNDYAKYNTVADSAREVADWLGRGKAAFEKVASVEDFAKALKFGRPGYAYYHTPSNSTDAIQVGIYISGMKKFYIV